jgi:hypothetical protein
MLAHSPRIVTQGLVLCLDAGNTKSYPGSGTTWTDLSGNGRTATLVNGVSYSSVDGGSMVFDGVNDVISSQSHTFTTNSSYTYEIWFNPDDAGSTDGLIGGTNNPAIRWGQVSGKVRLFLGWTESPGYLQIDSQSTLSSSSWHNVVGTVDVSTKTFSLYVNGNLSSSSTWATGTPSVPGTTIYFNQRDSANSFNGKISVGKVYNRALTAAEIAQNFQALRGRYGI